MGLFLQHLVDVAGQDAKVDQTLCQRPRGGLMGRVEARVGTRRGEGRALRRQHDLVKVALGRREAAVDGEGARHVGGVVLMFAAGVDEHEVAVPQWRVVLAVVQHAGVGAAGDDGRIGRRRGAAPHELMHQFRFEFRLRHAGSALAHGAQVAGGGDVGGLRHQPAFHRRLHQPLFMQQTAQGDELFRRTPPFERGDGLEQALVHCWIRPELDMHPRCAGQQRRQGFGQLAAGPRLV